MIQLIQTTSERSDCTAGYAVYFNGEDYTVRTFIHEILTKRKNEWGTIGIFVPIEDRESISDKINGKPYCEYKWGKLKSSLPEEIMDKQVVGASADGGWTRMDYILMLEGMYEE